MIYSGYKIVPEKLREYIVPDLTDFKLKPYVSELTPIEVSQQFYVTFKN